MYLPLGLERRIGGVRAARALGLDPAADTAPISFSVGVSGYYTAPGATSSTIDSLDDMTFDATAPAFSVQGGGDVALGYQSEPGTALVVNRDRRGGFRELSPTGPLISSVTSGWREASAPFRPDDLLVACTDGVLEARDAQGKEFGLDGVVDVLRRLRPWSPDEAVAACHQAVRSFAVDSRRDDVTCVALSLATSNHVVRPGA